MRNTLLLFLTLFLSTQIKAQYSADDTKKIEKSKELYNKRKYDKAISTIAKVQESYYFDNELWKLRVFYEYNRYQIQFSKDMQDLIKKINSPKTYVVDFAKLKSSKYRQEAISASIIATLFCEKQNQASGFLYDQFLSKNVDTAVADDAKEAYQDGDNEFHQENYSAAIKQYQKAIREDSTYFNAIHSIGLCYSRQEEWEKAIPWYQKAIVRQPSRLSPYHELVICYKKLKRWDDAYKVCIDGIIAYPSNFLFESLDEVCDKLGKTFNRHWMPRSYFPNRNVENLDAIEKEPWSLYRQAGKKIADYCDEDGLITKTQTMTEQKYMEPYSWEYMLKKDDSDEKEFGFARRMQEAGYLDCYTFVSLYHISFREQYVDFSKNNAERIRTFITTQLIK